jgi:hypothetical protein
MNSIVPLKLLGIVAFIMVFTYSAVAVLYDDDSYLIGVGGTYTESETQDLSDVGEDFSTAFQQAWQEAEILILTYGNPDFKNADFEYKLTEILGGIFLKYCVKPIGQKKWLAFYNNNVMYTQDDLILLDHNTVWFDYMTADERQQVAWQYNIYYGGTDISWGYDSYDYETDIQNNESNIKNDENTGFIPFIMDIFGSIPKGITHFINIVSFRGIPNIPDNVVFILNIFFIPLWIILIIGILPVIIETLKGLGTVIDAIIPF